MAITLLELMEKNWEGTLSDEEIEAELEKRGFNSVEKAMFWLAREKVRLENKYDLETGELD